MSHLIPVDANGSLIRVTVTEKLNLDDDKHIVPDIDRAIEELDAAREPFDFDEARGEILELPLPRWARVEALVCRADRGGRRLATRPGAGQAASIMGR